MQVDRKAQDFPSTLPHRDINYSVTHWSTSVGGPQEIVHSCTWDSRSEFVHIKIDPTRKHRRDSIFKGALCFDIFGWNIKRPLIAGLHEMFPDAQCRQRAASHRQDCKERNDKAVSIIQRICDLDVVRSVN